MKQLFCLVALMVGLVGLLVGCAMTPPPSPKTTNVEFTQQISDNNNIRIKFITGKGIPINRLITSVEEEHELEQAEIKRQLDKFINSGQFEIAQISITRCNGYDSHIISAEVYYRHKK